MTRSDYAKLALFFVTTILIAVGFRTLDVPTWLLLAVIVTSVLLGMLLGALCWSAAIRDGAKR